MLPGREQQRLVLPAPRRRLDVVEVLGLEPVAFAKLAVAVMATAGDFDAGTGLGHGGGREKTGEPDPL